MKLSAAHVYSVSGIRCSKCVRQLKALQSDLPGLSELTVDMSRQILKLKTSQGFDSQGFMNRTRGLGFETREISWDEGEVQNLKKKDQSQLARLGVAGALTGNIMLLSYSVYFGAPEQFLRIFNLISGVLFIPVLFYSGQDFFKNSWASLRLKRPSIDLPIAVALGLGGLISYFHLFTGSSEVYFDSLASLIFLLLASRFLVSRFQTKYLSPMELQDIFPKQVFLKLDAGEWVEAEADQLKPGDLIEVSHGAVVPADGVLASSQAEMDTSLMTGESDPQTVKKWDQLFAGTKCLSRAIQMKVKCAQSDSRMSEILHKLNRSLEKDSRLITLADQFASYFTLGIVFIGVLFFSVYSFVDFGAALTRVLALFVIACPCGLALVSPLILRLGLKRALRKDFLVKSVDTLERLNSCRAVVFDKTGTLTENSYESSRWFPRHPTQFESQIIFSLEEKSHHPLAKSVLANLEASRSHLALKELEKSRKEYSLEDWKETPGYGVSGDFEGNFYELKKSLIEGYQVGFFKNKLEQLSFSTEPRVWSEAISEVQQLKDLGMEVFLLTGDNQGRALEVAHQVQIEEKNVFFEVSPEWKAEFIEKLTAKKNVIYVGDGMNDSLAMANSEVGLSMQQSVEATFKASEVHFLKTGFPKVSELWLLAQKTIRVIRSLLFLSAGYNLLFGVLALSGFINPIVAAILMPLSSLSLLSFGVFQMRRV